MTRSDDAKRRRKGGSSNWSREKARIDAGKTGDKVPWPDPAAAPLGTDAEAGGATSGPAPADERTRPADAPPPAKK